jgi:hypothetical protein
MAIIIVRCHACGSDINTRINVDLATFQQLPQIESAMVCPSCGAQGFWDKARARLEEAPDDGRTAA